MINGPWVDHYPPGIERTLPPVTDDIVAHLRLETVDPDRVALRRDRRALGYGRLVEALHRVAAGLLVALLAGGITRTVRRGRRQDKQDRRAAA